VERKGVELDLDLGGGPGFEGRLLRWRGYDGDGVLRSRMELIPSAQYSVPLSLWLPYLVICMRHVRSQALNVFFPLISELERERARAVWVGKETLQGDFLESGAWVVLVRIYWSLKLDLHAHRNEERPFVNTSIQPTRDSHPY